MKNSEIELGEMNWVHDLSTTNRAALKLRDSSFAGLSVSRYMVPDQIGKPL